jgi:hypothetical protein
MQIKVVVWDEWNEEHIANHGVVPEEVEEVLVGLLALRLSRKLAKAHTVHLGRQQIDVIWQCFLLFGHQGVSTQ